MVALKCHFVLPLIFLFLLSSAKVIDHKPKFLSSETLKDELHNGSVNLQKYEADHERTHESVMLVNGTKARQALLEMRSGVLSQQNAEVENDTEISPVNMPENKDEDSTTYKDDGNYEYTDHTNDIKEDTPEPDDRDVHEDFVPPDDPPPNDPVVVGGKGQGGSRSKKREATSWWDVVGIAAFVIVIVAIVIIGLIVAVCGRSDADEEETTPKKAPEKKVVEQPPKLAEEHGEVAAKILQHPVQQPKKTQKAVLTWHEMVGGKTLYTLKHHKHPPAKKN